MYNILSIKREVNFMSRQAKSLEPQSAITPNITSPRRALKQVMIEAVENGLQRRKQIPGVAPQNILERMQELHVPNASITMMVDGVVAWSRDYDSDARTASDQRVDGHAPVFQAGSISKTVNAVLAMKLLVEAEKIAIDEDLTSRLSAMGVANPYTGKPITLAQLLSHTAGTTVHGGAGYATNSERIPSTAEILAGNAKLEGNPPEKKDTHIPNTGPIKVVREPGKECVYSGGGVTIVQRLIELEYPNESYASLAQKYIFEPLGRYDLVLMSEVPPILEENKLYVRNRGGNIEYITSGMQGIAPAVITPDEFPTRIAPDLTDLSAAKTDILTITSKRGHTPLGMTQSTFELQKPGNHVEHIQQGHGHDGRVIEGGWRMMPESAAGGLWTTSSDLAKFAIAIYQMSMGNTNNSILKPETVQQMLDKQPNASLPNASFGLGFAIYGDGDAVSFGHDGRMIGYSAEYIFFPRTGMGAVILTNSDNGNNLIEEIYCSIAENYDWPLKKSEVLQPIQLSDASLPLDSPLAEPRIAGGPSDAAKFTDEAAVFPAHASDTVAATLLDQANAAPKLEQSAVDIPDAAKAMKAPQPNLSARDDASSIAVLTGGFGFVSQSAAAQRAQLDMAAADFVDQKNDTTPAPGK